MTRAHSDMTPHEAREALAWLIAMGADEIVGERAVDQFAAKSKPAAPRLVAPPPLGPVALRAWPEECASVAELAAMLERFEDCPLKKTASHLCFSGGNLAGHLMVVGDVAGKEEDLAGRPFAGENELLLTKMLGAIGISPQAEEPAEAASLFNLIPWRPPGNRPPNEPEILQCLPFLMRAIELVRPKFILCFGALAAQRVTGRKENIMSLRGKWLARGSIPVVATFPPRLLLQQAPQKRLVWRDLVMLKEAMTGG
jgi:uracil-DNA glycosylase